MVFGLVDHPERCHVCFIDVKITDDIDYVALGGINCQVIYLKAHTDVRKSLKSPYSPD